MASVDNYEEYHYEDAPDHRTTPLAARNLNHAESGIKKNNTAIKEICTELDAKAANVQTFDQAASRANINSGESVGTVFGKIKKWFADLGAIAFVNTNGSTANFLRGDGSWATPPNTTYSNGAGLNLSGTQFSVKYGSSAGTACQGNDSRLSNARPASDVYSWAKAATKPSYSKAEVGLGNVDNTADSVKSVRYASYAGRANEAGGSNDNFIISNGKQLWLRNIYDQYSALMTSNNGTLHMAAPAWINLRSGNQVQCRNTDDTGWVPCAASSYPGPSSLRYKEHITDITDDIVKKILNVRVVGYDYKEGIVDSKRRFDRHGVIAEEVKDIIPEVVSWMNDGKKEIPDGVDYSAFVPYLIRMVQLQQNEIEELKRRLA